MSKRSLKRLAAPKTWPIKRKENKWVTRPCPGGQPIDRGIPINILFKNLLKLTKTTRETKQILKDGKILINKIPRTDYKFHVGLFDVIELPTQHYFRLLFNKKGKFILHPIKKEESSLIIYKIVNKSVLKDKKIQFNLHNGKNIIIEKDNYKVGDTITLDEKNNINHHLKFEKGALLYLFGGKHIAEIVTLQAIHKAQGSQPNRIEVKLDNKSTFDTLKKYSFVVGKEKPIITLPK